MGAAVKIGPVRRERRHGLPAVCADVLWEEAGTSPAEIVFSFDDEEGAEPSDGADAFLIGLFLPALRGGERRIRVEGEVSPRLRDGLRKAAGVLERWYGDGWAMPSIEAAGGFRARTAAQGAAGAFVSGGLDSLFLVKSHRERFSRSRPDALRLGILIDGLAMVADAATAAKISASSRAAAAAIATASGLPLTIVSTNLLGHHGDFEFFSRKSHGSMLAAVAQLHAGRIGSAWVAASDDVSTGLGPWGSHPALDPLFGTEAVAMIHDGTGYARAEKARLLARAPEARDHLFVCFEPPAGGSSNCGSCEKCLRTMLELLAGGGLAHSRVFPRDVDPASILALPGVPSFRALSYYWAPLVEPLRHAGRADLADAVERRLEMDRRAKSWHADRGWKGRLRRLDRALLGGLLLSWRRSRARSGEPRP